MRPFELLPELGRGGLVVDAWVRGVRELVRHPRSGRVSNALGLLDRGEHAALRIGQHEAGAVRQERALPLLAHLRGQAQGKRVPARGRHLRESDAGVAGRRLHDHLAGAQCAAPFGVDDHAERRAVLDGPAGVHPLDLDPHFRHSRARRRALGGRPAWCRSPHRSAGRCARRGSAIVQEQPCGWISRRREERADCPSWNRTTIHGSKGRCLTVRRRGTKRPLT